MQHNNETLPVPRHPSKTDPHDRADKPKPSATQVSKKEEVSPKPIKVADSKRDSDKKADALRNSTEAKKNASNPQTKVSTPAHTSSTTATKTNGKPQLITSPQAAHFQETPPTKKNSHSKTQDHQIQQPPSHSLAESLQSAQSTKVKDPPKKHSRSDELELKVSELQIEIEKYAKVIQTETVARQLPSRYPRPQPTALFFESRERIALDHTGDSAGEPQEDPQRLDRGAPARTAGRPEAVEEQERLGRQRPRASVPSPHADRSNCGSKKASLRGKRCTTEHS